MLVSVVDASYFLSWTHFIFTDYRDNPSRTVLLREKLRFRGQVVMSFDHKFLELNNGGGSTELEDSMVFVAPPELTV